MTKPRSPNAKNKTKPAPPQKASLKRPAKAARMGNTQSESADKQNRYLSLLNQFVRSILLSGDIDSVLTGLAKNMAVLTEADDCYITLWDEERQLTITQATTASLERPYKSEGIFIEPNMTASVLKAGRSLVVEDVFKTPYIHLDIANRYPARSVIGVPLIVREHKLGAVVIAFNSPHRFTPHEVDRAEYAAEHIAVAVWSARQDIEIENRFKEQKTLARITTALSQTERIGLSNLLKLIVDSARELIQNAEQAVIHLIDIKQSSLIPRAVSGFESSEEGKGKMRIGEGVAGQVVSEGKSIYIPDVNADDRFVSLNPVVSYQSLLVTPVLSGGQTLGTLSIQSRIRHGFSKNDINLLNELGQQAAIAIDNAHLLEATRQALKETSALYRINQGLVALNANELLNEAVELLQTNFGYYHAQIFMIDSKTGNLLLKAASGETGKKLVERRHEVRAGAGIIGYAAETGMAFFTNNVDEVVFFRYDPYLPETKAEMAIPVRRANKLYGILDIQQTAPKPFTERDQQLVTTVADQLAVALHKAELYEDLQTALQQEKATRNQLIQNERLAIMGKLLASVSHELNNPLQAIQNALFLLKEEQGISQQGLNDLEIVIAETERMANMIERLRTTYRPAHAEDLQPTHINSIIEDVYALIGTHLRKNEVSFEFLPDSELPVVQAMPDQIRQVALNLMMNAVEAMESGGKLTVFTRYLSETNEMLLSVSDTGAGIPTSILPIIFDPFVTNKKRGTGIGLTISHDIVLKHGGRIAAENNPSGSGATFKVWLPLGTIPAE